MNNLRISLSLSTAYSNECLVRYESSAHANHLVDVVLEGEGFEGVPQGAIVTHLLSAADRKLVEMRLEFLRGPLTEIEIERRERRGVA